MTALLVVIVTALVAVAAAAVLGPRLGIASPLVLVVMGVGASFLPMLPPVVIEPEWVLQGILPPLLYSSAVSMPAMNFRREFGAIGGLSVLLVVGTSLVLGLFFLVAVPDLGFAWGVALGAIVSPTDAVATSIVKGTAVSRRVVAMLDGESLLNDATALVLLRTAIVAAAAGFSFWGAVGSFAYSVTLALALGIAVGALDLAVRRRIADPTVTTVLSFTVPFLAAVPAELLGASGLVAAVVAGVVTGVRAPRELSPRNRLSDSQNWRTVELVLEGVVFLAMGLQMRSIVTSVEEDHAGVWPAVLVAAGALLLTLLVRAAYVGPLLAVLASRGRLRERMRPRVEGLNEQMTTPEGRRDSLESLGRRRRRPSARDLDRFSVRLRRMLADMEYFVREPLGWRDGTAVVWAGMRGAVTVAAAQTLPEDTPQRSVLVLIAFAVAALSLLIQGGTIGPLLRLLAPQVDGEARATESAAERERIYGLLRTSAEAVAAPIPVPEDRSRAAFEAARTHRLAVIAAQRSALLDARDDGTFDADVLASVLAALDATEIEIDLRAQAAG
ncbi:cation:proton antiporter [Rathayibacter iranicus]|uniref:Cation:proton antiporter n=2 Tax=Rathayibacter iranicus TaxID=59737 RepID=A0AAD1AF36_9MICO|nr:cation:proton antiporter [Rathayibacter iranicus]AZZ56272.1 cation:proton antiporter [Rathayibacter iranicus]MWV30013.1 sodium:proton antiporter [Rathayibacter iranicus NCPPB 2253 = VKM Ac-1602]PPI45884.1 cation:proton antiporter [Rathayibacter iranicus]PPI59713.1 cation:proton antiporter [Rathayibacter iranicus]PPI70722.1 cation:proton antiporter [Rathayibacter iranicus]